MRRRRPIVTRAGNDTCPNDAEGAAWAAELQVEYGAIWLVLWEVAGKHLTAFYKGPAPEGIFVKGRTPQDLQERVSATFGERRLTVQPSIVNEMLPAPERGRG
jgi:hypothetical protein